MNHTVSWRREWRPLAVLLALVSLVWAYPVLAPGVSIHWDALGYFYPVQRHLSDSLRAGHWPVWTDAVFCGFPFLADMQVAAWYPLHWPFLLAGVGPKTLFAELWLGALLAALGTYLLCRKLPLGPWPAVLGGLCFALAGTMTGHAQHISLYDAACWLPLLCWLLWRAGERPSPRRLAVLALGAGCLILTGHFQTVLYVFSALGLVAAWRTRAERWRTWAALGVAAVGGALLAAVQLLPSFELLGLSIRSELAATQHVYGMAMPVALATWVNPGAAGHLQTPYTGPADITQQYYYAGVLLLPLALLGLLKRESRWVGALLAVVPMLYALGPGWPLYELLVRLPGFGSVRSPAHAVFVTSLGLALLAAAGAEVVSRSKAWPVLALIAVFAVDLAYWNMWRSPLVYERQPFSETYGKTARWLQETLRTPLGQGERVAAPGRWLYPAPLDAPYELGFHITFGSNPLATLRWWHMTHALERNPSLLRVLGVTRVVSKDGFAVEVQEAEGRFTFPDSVSGLGSEAEVERALPMTDFSHRLLFATEHSIDGVPANSSAARVAVQAWRDNRYELRTSVPQLSLMRAAISYYPGWQARTGDRPLKVIPVDHNLIGVEIPPGQHTVVLEYRPRQLALGGWISAATLAACLAVLGLKGKRDYSHELRRY